MGNRIVSARRRLLLVCLWLLLAVLAAAQDTALREEFDDLSNWKPLLFPKISSHSTYTIESAGEERYLKAASKASASGLIFARKFDVFEHPVLRWRWKVDAVYDRAEVGTKQGDDYPIRVYVLFEFDPELATPLERISFAAARRRYGEYPPYSALNYVWSSSTSPLEIVPNPYADRSRMILVRQGSARLGEWIEERRNIVEDYRRAFGAEPPATASLAVMNDSDDTGESSVSYLDFLELSRQ